MNLDVQVLQQELQELEQRAVEVRLLGSGSPQPYSASELRARIHTIEAKCLAG